VPITDFMGLDDLGAISSEIHRTDIQRDPGPFHIAEKPDMGDLNILLGSKNSCEAGEFVHVGGEHIIGIHAHMVQDFKTNGSVFGSQWDDFLTMGCVQQKKTRQKEQKPMTKDCV
jgi:hypothetical protein